jgi:hypothetical protein
MSQGIKIIQLSPVTSITDNDNIPLTRGGLETYRIPASIFVTTGFNIGGAPGQFFAAKTGNTPTTLQFRTLSATGETLSVNTVGNTVVVSASGSNPVKRSHTGDGTTTAWPLAPTFNSVNAANYRVDIDGVLQEAFIDYFISNNNLVFVTPPLSSSKIVIVSSNITPLTEAVVSPNSITTDMLINGVITTAKLSSSFYNNQSNYLVLPSVSAVSALDVGAPGGSVSYTRDTGLLYYKNRTQWIPATGRLGSVTRPALNAQAIIDAGDSLGDGAYWIQSLSGPVLTYCDMVNGGYMLAAVLESSTSQFWAWNGAGWTSLTPVQENETAVYKIGTGGAVGGITAALNSLNRIFYEFTLTTGVRCCLGNKNNA